MNGAAPALEEFPDEYKTHADFDVSSPSPYRHDPTPRGDTTSKAILVIVDTTDAEEDLTARIDINTQINSAAAAKEFVGILNVLGIGRVAGRLSELSDIADEEPEQAPISIDSLRQLVHFIVNERDLGDPRVGLSEDGTLTADWKISDQGALAVWFFENAVPRFAAISSPYREGVQRRKLSGSVRSEKIIPALENADIFAGEP